MGIQLRLPQKAAEPPKFSAHICCGQMVGWIKMPLDTEVGLSAGHIELDGAGTQLPHPAKWAQQPPLFGPYPLWPNG